MVSDYDMSIHTMSEVTDDMGRALIKKHREVWPNAGWPDLVVAKMLVKAALDARVVEPSEGLLRAAADVVLKRIAGMSGQDAMLRSIAHEILALKLAPENRHRRDTFHMSDIPADVMKAALDAFYGIHSDIRPTEAMDHRIAQAVHAAVMAERERCADIARTHFMVCDEDDSAAFSIRRLHSIEIATAIRGKTL